MKILSVGAFSTYGVSNTCTLRDRVLHKLADVVNIDTTILTKKDKFRYKWISRLYRHLHLPISFSYISIQNALIESVTNETFDLVWIDKGIHIYASTIKKVKEISPKTIIVGFTPDNMFVRHNMTKHFMESLPYYDCYITTKSYNVSDFRRYGIKNVYFANNSYEETFHYPRSLTQLKQQQYNRGNSIGFIGSWEQERCNTILYLVNRGISVTVWGDGEWCKYSKIPNLTVVEEGLFGENYAEALSSFDISLCFLRKKNYDLQTSRSMEIPACGSLLVAERTKEHQKLFKEDVEAIFFDSDEELASKCQYYLEHPADLAAIAKAGYEKVKSAGYSNEATIKNFINQISEDFNSQQIRK